MTTSSQNDATILGWWKPPKKYGTDAFVFPVYQYVEKDVKKQRTTSVFVTFQPQTNGLYCLQMSCVFVRVYDVVRVNAYTIFTPHTQGLKLKR